MTHQVHKKFTINELQHLFFKIDPYYGKTLLSKIQCRLHQIQTVQQAAHTYCSQRREGQPVLMPCLGSRAGWILFPAQTQTIRQVTSLLCSSSHILKRSNNNSLIIQSLQNTNISWQKHFVIIHVCLLCGLD